MMSKKELSQHEYFHCLCLFKMAQDYQKQVDMFEQKIHDILELELGSHVSDALYCDEDIDGALEREGIKHPTFELKGPKDA